MKRFFVGFVLLSSACIFLQGCPLFNSCDPHDYYHSYEPVKPSIGQLDHSIGTVMQVNEKDITIAMKAQSYLIQFPIEAKMDIEGAHLKVWLENFTGPVISSTAAQYLDLNKGLNVVQLTLTPNVVDDNRNIRLAYNITSNTNGTTGATAYETLYGRVSVFDNLSQLRLFVYTPNPVAAGDSATIRVAATFAGRAVRDFDVNIVLSIGGSTITTQVHSTSMGIATTSIDIPEDFEGDGQITVTATTADGMTKEHTVPVTVEKRGALLLTTDKPRYQPSQTMHLRVMALQRPEMTPLSDQEVVIEIEDAKAYKVFRETVVTNSFGIASTIFKLASEVNMGTYKIKAMMGEQEKEEQVIVEYYVLPKFDIVFTPTRNFILPGVAFEGIVDLRYTFGEPVVNGVVSMTLAYSDGSEIAKLTGGTNERGRYSFSMSIPPLKYTASVKLTIEATDLAGQKTSKEFAIVTSEQGIRIWVVPATDRVLGADWELFIIARDPSGNPVETNGTVSYGSESQSISTNSMGIATVSLPAGFDWPSLIVSLQTNVGNLSGSASVDMSEKDFPYGISLHTDFAQYVVGSTLSLSIAGPGGLKEAQIEVLKRGEVLYTQTFSLNDGSIITGIPITDEMDGVTLIEAYGIDDKGDILRGRTAVYVFSEKKLTIDTSLDKEIYRPGDTAKLNLSVHDRQGDAVAAAIGLVIVDEAVFALQSFTPTTYKRFFAEQTVSDNVTHVMDKEPAEALLETEGGLTDEQESASRAVLAANAFEQSASDTDLKDIDKEMEIYWASFVINNDLFSIANYFSDLSRYKAMSIAAISVEAQKLEPETGDPWGRSYDIEIQDTTPTMTVFLTSGGPDERLGTDDDITVQMTANR